MALRASAAAGSARMFKAAPPAGARTRAIVAKASAGGRKVTMLTLAPMPGSARKVASNVAGVMSPAARTINV